jgi:peptidoglycan/LPS O-acetylase OafA/YrhL
MLEPPGTPGLRYQLPKSIPQLDRLRGLAILLVVIFHVWKVFPPVLFTAVRLGWVGVDLFFVLSGFLITGILLDTRENKGYFWRFYGKRVLRIWPAYLLLLIFTFCAIPILRLVAGRHIPTIPGEVLGIWAYLLMIQNFFGVGLGASLFLRVTWSLAIEEQFYLIWPAVIRFISKRTVMLCLFAAFLSLPMLRIWALHCGVSQWTIYINPVTHGDGLFCGAVVAIWLRSAKPKRSTLLITGTALLAVCSGISIALIRYPVMYPVFDPTCYPFVFTAVALSSTGLLLVALVSENAGGFLHRNFFMNKTLAFFGLISYSLYLYHETILRFTIGDKLLARIDIWHHPNLTARLAASFGIGLSILIAWLSRVTIERMALSKKRIFDQP